MSWTWDQTDLTHDQTCWTYDGYNGCTSRNKDGEISLDPPSVKRVKPTFELPYELVETDESKRKRLERKRRKKEKRLAEIESQIAEVTRKTLELKLEAAEAKDRAEFEALLAKQETRLEELQAKKQALDNVISFIIGTIRERKIREAQEADDEEALIMILMMGLDD